MLSKTSVFQISKMQTKPIVTGLPAADSEAAISSTRSEAKKLGNHLLFMTTSLFMIDKGLTAKFILLYLYENEV